MDRFSLFQTTDASNLDTILAINKLYIKNHDKNNGIMRFLRSKEIAQQVYRNRMLDVMQIMSDFFQKTVMLRRVFAETPRFVEIAQLHLDEEFNHNNKLRKDRKKRPIIWDPVVESAASWFAWKMFTLNDTGKTLLVHLVLESSANIFFHKADQVMRLYNDTEYFSDHAEVDEEHEDMGVQLLEGLTEREYQELAIVQQQGWSILNLVFNRIAEVILNLDNSAAEKAVALKQKQ